MAQAFSIATGWLGWSPEEAWNATIPEIECAIDGKIEWLKITTPGVKKKEEPKPFSEFVSQIRAIPGTKVYGK